MAKKSTHIRENVTIAAHESQSKYSMLDDVNRELTIQETWKTIFLANRLGPERDLKDRMIAIRFIIQREHVVRRNLMVVFLFDAHYFM